jgi:required for meiotic nuclear division protein 1
MAEDAPMSAASKLTAAPPLSRRTARALLIGERINTAGLERNDVFSTTPLSFAAGDHGFVAVFRYGVVVLIGLSPLEEDEVLRALEPRVVRALPAPWDEESLTIQVGADGEEGIGTDGLVQIRAAAPAQLLVVADTLAKSAAMAYDEGQVAAVVDAIEPFADALAREGRTPGGRQAMLKLIGRALQVRHRVSGRVAVHEKPDVLWDRPDLERLYARLQDEYEIVERAEALDRKLAVVGETATALTDLIDTQRALGLELAVVLLIVVEVVLGTLQLLWRR